MKKVILVSFLCFLLFSHLFAQNISNLNLSTVHLPVTYSQEELEESLNRYYLEEEQGIFCKDTSFTNFDNDNLKNICRQKDKIKISITNGYVLTQVPIQIDAVYLIDKSFTFNIWFYKKTFNFKLEKNISFNIFVTFKTSVKINDDLILLPQTTWSFKWLSFPQLDFGFFSFRISKLVKKAISRTLKIFAKNRINKTIIEKVNIKNIIKTAKELTSSPFVIDKKRGIWSLIKTKDFRSGQIDLNQGKIQFYFESDFYGYLGFNFEELIPFMTKSAQIVFYPPLPTKSKTDSFYVDFSMDISAKKLEKLISEVLFTRSIQIGSADRIMEINEIYIKKIRDFIETEIYLKNVNSGEAVQQYRLFLKFRPYYSQEEKKVKIKNLTYKVITDSHLVNLGSLLFQTTLQANLEKNIEISLEDFINSIKKNINQDFKKKKIDNQKLLNMNVKSLVVNDVTTSSTSLIVFLTAEGNASLELIKLF